MPRTTCFHLMLCAVVLLAHGCSGQDGKADQAALREMVGQGARIAEEQNIDGLLAMTGEGFVSHPGPWDRPETEAILRRAFERYGRITIRHLDPLIQLVPGTKSAALHVSFVILDAGTKVPDLAHLPGDAEHWLAEMSKVGDTYQLNLILAKTGGAWKVTSATLIGIRARIA